MVTGASWADVDGSGTTDLVIVGEWMAPQVYLNNGSALAAASNESGLAGEVGWWNCITPGDFDNDGDIDFIAGNLGLNYNFRASSKWPFEIYAGDVDNNGKIDIILGYYNEGILYPWHGFMRSNAQVPVLKYKYSSYAEFGKATLADIYGEDNLNNALNYKARNFASSYLENQGDGKFSVTRLPNPAQISAVNSVIAEDINGDGILDLIIAGNQHGSESEVTRADGGLGLYLQGDGQGNFTPFPAVETGLYIEGDVKQAGLIRIGPTKTPVIIAAKNNGKIQMVRVNRTMF